LFASVVHHTEHRASFALVGGILLGILSLAIALRVPGKIVRHVLFALCWIGIVEILAWYLAPSRLAWIGPVAGLSLGALFGLEYDHWRRLKHFAHWVAAYTPHLRVVPPRKGLFRQRSAGGEVTQPSEENAGPLRTSSRVRAKRQTFSTTSSSPEKPWTPAALEGPAIAVYVPDKPCERYHDGRAETASTAILQSMRIPTKN
jgi:hypothetical protein